jgi:hypothetical protein
MLGLPSECWMLSTRTTRICSIRLLRHLVFPAVAAVTRSLLQFLRLHRPLPCLLCVIERSYRPQVPTLVEDPTFPANDEPHHACQCLFKSETRGRCAVRRESADDADTVLRIGKPLIDVPQGCRGELKGGGVGVSLVRSSNFRRTKKFHAQVPSRTKVKPVA